MARTIKDEYGELGFATDEGVEHQDDGETTIQPVEKNDLRGPRKK